MEICGQSVYLRLLCEEDAKTSFKWRNDATIWCFTEGRPNRVVTYEMELAWVRKVMCDKTRANFAICEKGTNKYVGNIYLVNIMSERCELGIFIGDAESRGRRYGEEALTLLAQYAREYLSVKRIDIRFNLKNMAALKSYIRAGAFCADDQWVTFTLPCK